MTLDQTILTCHCGQVEMAVDGPPILSVECLCADCRKASALFAGLPGASPVADQKGATPFVMHRKDRVHCTAGRDALREHRLTPDSKTRRVLAGCCNTPIFLDFTQGHWLSLYADLWPHDARAPLQLRTMTRDAPDRQALPDDVPNLKTHNIRFFAMLIGAWAAMRFRTPKIDYVKGVVDV